MQKKIASRLPFPIEMIIRRTVYHLYSYVEKITDQHFDRYDFQTWSIIKKVLNKNATCVDIGAHKGIILSKLINASPNGRHYAFEPVPALYKKLQKRFGKRANILPYAISDCKTEKEFYVFNERPALSGFYQRPAAAASYASAKINVQTIALDECLPDEKIDLIKIDVEGAEFEVLKGAKTILKKDKPLIFFETGIETLAVYHTTPEMIFDLIDSCGLHINLLEYFSRNLQSLSKNEFCNQLNKGYNCFFIAYDPSLHH
jgi:FkbM family methyltransferase